jgi:hypothetical protein
MIEAVIFTVNVQNSGPRFAVPIDVRDALGLPRKGYADGSDLYLHLWDAVSGEKLWEGEKKLRSGPEVYGHDGHDDIGWTLEPGQALRVKASKISVPKRRG